MGFFSRVSLEVLVEAAHRNESHVAAFTGERFVPAVPSLMRYELRLNPESLIAQVAAEVVLSQVHAALVGSEAGPRGETLPTLVTGKSGLWMGQMMRFEISEGFELLLTNATAERRLVGVGELMFLQLVQPIKHPPANVAGAFFFFGVLFHVAIEPTAQRERHAADFTDMVLLPGVASKVDLESVR